MNFFRRVLGMHPFALLAAILLLPPASIWLWKEQARVGRPEAALQAAIDKHAAVIEAQLSRVLDGDPNGVLPEDRAPLRRLVLAEVDAQASGLRGDVFGELAMLRTASSAQLTGIRSDASAQLTGIRSDALKAIDKATAPANDLVAALKPAIAHVTSITAHVDDTLPQFTDCAYYEDGLPVSGNQDCVFNRFQGVSKSLELMARAGAAAAPKLADEAVGIGDSFRGMAEDAHKATSDFVAPKTFWQKFKGWLELSGKLAARFL